MKLNAEQIRSITLGAVRITETDSGVRLYRFTEEQEKLYTGNRAEFLPKCHASAGMKLRFQTDSTFLSLKVCLTPGSSRKYFSFDVTVDGKTIGHLDNYATTELPLDYTTIQLPLGEFSRTFSLGEGVKEVCVYLPWSVSTEIRELALDDGAFLKPVKPGKKLIAFGDSITHGYDALCPSMRYMSRLADALDAEEINKAIGGEIFFPRLAETPDDFAPDYITVAYGTNDWSILTQEEFKSNCYGFYSALSRNYPDTKIFAITPIWRKDYKDYRPFGEFEKATEYIRSITEEFPNITCITGFAFVPQSEDFFADLRLHPNDAGFDHYFQNLYAQIQNYI